MSQAPASPLLPPRWVVMAGSAAIAFHLFAVVIAALDAPSGPWPTPFGSSTAIPPQFAYRAAENLTLPYGRLVKVTHSFRFDSNHQEMPEVFFEARLKDRDGQVVKTLRFPEDSANPWVRHRQNILAAQLGEDVPVPPPQGVLVAPPGGELPRERGGVPDGERHLKLVEDTLNAVPRNRPVMKPSEWTNALVRSYARYLGRTHDAAAVEIVRHWRDPIYPTVLFAPQPPSEEELKPYVASFGDLSR